MIKSLAELAEIREQKKASKQPALTGSKSDSLKGQNLLQKNPLPQRKSFLNTVRISMVLYPMMIASN